MNLNLIAQSFLDTIFFVVISFPLLFMYSWPDSWTFLHLFIIEIGLLIGHFLKICLSFGSYTAFSTLSIRSFIQDLTSSIFSSIRISLIMLLNPSASKETGLSENLKESWFYCQVQPWLQCPQWPQRFQQTQQIWPHFHYYLDKILCFQA